MNAINRMVHRWNVDGTSIEARLEEALKRLEGMAEDRLRLDQRIRQQRIALRENWQIVEMRAAHRRAWLQSPLLKAMLKRGYKRAPWWRRALGQG